MSTLYDEENKVESGKLAPTQTNTYSERRGSVISVKDAVFGEITEHGPNYRNVHNPSTRVLHQLTINRLGGLERSLS
jgi:hypothetical protein